jgi:DNA-binding GntR family transcriptional regulator
VSFLLQPSSLVDALYASLRKRIVNGEIPPGEPLTEARISKDYSVARTTARACLERLTAEGVLKRGAHKSAVVPHLTPDDIKDLFFSRLTLEQTAVAALAEGKTIPAAAKKAQIDIEQAAENRDFVDQVEADIAFHTALVRATGSERLTRMHQMIMGEVQLSMGQYQAHRTAGPTAVAEEHAAILHAIRDGDVDAARMRVFEHLNHALERLLSHEEELTETPEETA